MSIYNIDVKFIKSAFRKNEDNLMQVILDGNSQGLYFVNMYDEMDNKYNYLKILKKIKNFQT